MHRLTLQSAQLSTSLIIILERNLTCYETQRFLDILFSLLAEFISCLKEYIFLQLTRLHLKKKRHSRVSILTRPGSEAEIKSPRLCRFEPERSWDPLRRRPLLCEMRPPRYGSRGASFFFNCRCMISWLDCEAPGKVISKSHARTETSFSLAAALKIPHLARCPLLLLAGAKC